MTHYSPLLFQILYVLDDTHIPLMACTSPDVSPVLEGALPGPLPQGPLRGIRPESRPQSLLWSHERPSGFPPEKHFSFLGTPGPFAAPGTDSPFHRLFFPRTQPSWPVQCGPHRAGNPRSSCGIWPVRNGEGQGVPFIFRQKNNNKIRRSHVPNRKSRRVFVFFNARLGKSKIGSYVSHPQPLHLVCVYVCLCVYARACVGRLASPFVMPWLATRLCQAGRLPPGRCFLCVRQPLWGPGGRALLRDSRRARVNGSFPFPIPIKRRMPEGRPFPAAGQKPGAGQGGGWGKPCRRHA